MAEYPPEFHPLGLTALRGAGGFSGAQVWRVTTAAGICALRATPRSGIVPERLTGLHRLLVHVQRLGISQSPMPIRTMRGGTWIEQASCVWQLEPWMPGAPEATESPSKTRIAAALALLARWHQAAVRYVPSAADAGWFASCAAGTPAGLCERLAVIARWDRARCELIRARLRRREWPEFDEPGERLLALYQREAPAIARDLEIARGTTVPLQPCLRDVWKAHVLFEGDAVTGLIDPHACRTESLAADVARLLGSLVGDDRKGWDVGLTAYQQLRPLNLDELGLVELYDRSTVLLSGLTWLEWQHVEKRRFDQPLRVVARLQSILARLERLVEGTTWEQRSF
ncbi:MAG: phosphotransferase [Planctomycetales bacterium]